MSEVKPGPAILCGLVEEVVSEEFEHVPVPRLTPAAVAVDVRPVHHRRQLSDEAEEAPVVQLLAQLTLIHVGTLCCTLHSCVESKHTGDIFKDLVA